MTPNAPTLELSDPLAELLGSLAPGETFHYSYEDAVKLSGHSCPTVAGAWLMMVAGLRALYPHTTPVRGEIEVIVGGAPDGTSSGPMAQVIAQVTGAAGETGFAGLAGQFRRRGLLRFDPQLGGRIRFRRVDTGRAVDVLYEPGKVPPSEALRGAMARSLGGDASPVDRARFAELWQRRVGEILGGALERVVQVFPAG